MKKNSSKADNSLRDALAASFQPSEPPSLQIESARKTSGGEFTEEQDGLVIPTENPGPSLRKTTISFQSDEQMQIDKILDLLLQTKRHRGGFSDAVKIALRLCPLDAGQIAKAWDAARAEDRRTKRHHNA